MKLRVTNLNRNIRVVSNPYNLESRFASVEAERLWQEQHHAKRLAIRAAVEPQWRKARDGVTFGDEMLEESDLGVFTLAAEERQRGRTVSACRAQYLDALEYWITSEMLAGKSASVTLPFVMPGGSFSIRFVTYRQREADETESDAQTLLEEKLELTVRSGSTFATGFISMRGINEYSGWIISLKQETPQHVADSVAAVLDLFNAFDGDAKENYPAFIPRSDRCFSCNRPLKDETSKAIGLGPDCAGSMGIPHNEAIAKALQAKREHIANEFDVNSGQEVPK